MRFRKLVVVAAVGMLLPLGFAGCTGKSSGPISEDDLAKQLQQNGQSKDFSKCVAKILINGDKRVDHGKKLSKSDRKAFNDNDPANAARNHVFELAAKAGPVCKDRGHKP